MVATLLSLAATQVLAVDSAPRTPNVNTDTNGDGKVSYDEYRASKEKKIERQFKRMDTNGDGFIDADEKQAQKDKMHEMREKRKQSELN
jgi:Ca2+-binding EF-hand superfamily protein